MKQFLVSFLFVLISLRLCAQMNPAGDPPKAVYKKYPAEFPYLTVSKFVAGDLGWEDNFLNAFCVDHTGRMWIAGNHGLSYSDDNGLNWKISTSKYATYAIFETRKHTLLSSSNNEFLLRSTDDGKNWENTRVSNVGSGRSSHGERYDDIFYVQVDDKRIIRTCQYNDILLVSDDDGVTWSKEKAPDTPESIFNIGDSLLVMFTYDDMYVSENRGNSWKRKRDGLPKNISKAENDRNSGIIASGTVMDDGTIIAMVESQEEGSYDNYMYFFDTKSDSWKRSNSTNAYTWKQSGIYNGGKDRLLLYNSENFEFDVSYDKGATWGKMFSNEHMWDFPFSVFPNDNNVYFIHYTDISVIHFPAACTTVQLPADYQVYTPEDTSRNKLVLFPSPEKFVDSKAPFGLYQLCAWTGEGYSRFLLHIPSDTNIEEIKLLHRYNGRIIVAQLFKTVVSLGPGDYELLYYNSTFRGCYYLNIVFKGAFLGDQSGTVCYFY